MLLCYRAWMAGAHRRQGSGCATQKWTAPGRCATPGGSRPTGVLGADPVTRRQIRFRVPAALTPRSGAGRNYRMFPTAYAVGYSLLPRSGAGRNYRMFPTGLRRGLCSVAPFRGWTELPHVSHGLRRGLCSRRPVPGLGGITACFPRLRRAYFLGRLFRAALHVAVFTSYAVRYSLLLLAENRCGSRRI